MTASVRIGTCSFADDSLSRYWYPRRLRSGEDRLRFYAERFDTVEVDSTYYRLPDPALTGRWAERTPDGFVFHVKAFGMMTRHPVRLEQLPPDLRDRAESDAGGRVDRPSAELRDEVFRRFHEALDPLRESGKLGGILLQFPPYVVPKPSSFAYLEWAKEALRGDQPLIEFRHRSWLADDRRAEVLAFLEERAMTLVVVDAPRSDAKNVLPTVVATTTDSAYVRMHGRNARTWNIRGRSAAERFDYLYSEAELAEWIEPLRTLAESSREVYVVFNNNGRSAATNPERDIPAEAPFESLAEPVWIAQAPANATDLRRLLRDAGLPVADPSS